MLRILSLLLVLAVNACACSKSGDNTPGPNPGPGGTTTTLKSAPFPMGAAVVPGRLKSNVNCSQTVIAEFNSITAENAMKMSALSTAKGQYSWADADYIVDFAKRNDMRVHGHTLIWHRAVPAWVNSFQGDKDAWKAMMKEYIQAVVTHFKGKVASWDVVNEALEDDGSWRETIWYANIGKEYVDLAFQYAREADPDVVLFYNDYGMEYSAAKRTAICTLVSDMKSRGIPVDGIGLQMHVNAYSNYSTASFQQPIQAAAACGVKVHISELDVAVNNIERPDPTLKFTVALAEKQKQTYKAMVEAMLSIPAAQRFGITIWGVSDADSWLTPNPDWPLPFDAAYGKKMAYYGMIEGFSK